MLFFGTIVPLVSGLLALGGAVLLNDMAWSQNNTDIPLSPVPGQRVRLDVALHVKVKQDH